MRAAIVSDIHGNRHAFEAVLAAVADEGLDEVWCLGDLVGYGAEPDACVELAREHAAICLAGNHDLAVTGALATTDFSQTAALAARWSRGVIDLDNLNFLQALLPEGTESGIGLYHASPRDPIWEYVLSVRLADRCLDIAPHAVSLVGHSHVALSFWRADGVETAGTVREPGERVALADDPSTRWVINPGSVGQPRDGDPRAAWLDLDLDAGTAQWRRTDYDVEGAQAAIRAAGLPASLADRLGYGQ